MTTKLKAALCFEENATSHWGVFTPPTPQRFNGNKVASCSSKEWAQLFAAVPDMLSALEGLFEHCVMTHKHWGEGCNRQQADDAIAAARAAIRKATAAP